MRFTFAGTRLAWDFSVLTDQLRMLMRIKRNIIDSHPELALADDKCAAKLLELIVSSIHRDHGGVVEGELPWASHVVMLFQVYMVNSTYCERMFALADRLHGKLCGGGGMPEADLPHLFKSYLLSKEIGIPLAEAMQSNGMLESVARKLLRKERRSAKSHLREVHQSKRGQFLGKVRLRAQRSDKGGVRGPQKHSKKAKNDRVKRQQAVVFAGLKRGSAEASVETVGKKAVKAADADHPIPHSSSAPKAKAEAPEEGEDERARCK